MMYLFLIALGVLLLSGVFSLLCGRNSRLASKAGAFGSAIGAFLGLPAALFSLFADEPCRIKVPLTLPFASFNLELDALSALFLLPILLISGLGALFGGEYLREDEERKRTGVSWFFYSVLVAGMALVVTARNGVLFLMAWEIMTLASYFLVTYDDEKAENRKAGLIYFIASHIGTAFLFFLFLGAARETGSMEFEKWDALKSVTPAVAGVFFVCAVIGFGTKAGFMPLHVWLPEAHPAAPSHVSALMSGVMIKTGIYGLMRIISYLPAPENWQAYTLIIIGVTSGVWGVLFALAQHDIKRLLAYHSVENIGIIAMGLGLGLLGKILKSPEMTILGFGGALLHSFNHSMFKSALFFGAGAVIHATGTRDIDQMGGLAKKMPLTALGFLVAAAAISGLPPLNGFLSEFLIYLGAFQGALLKSGPALVASALIIVGLALIGGLALACFTKAFGTIFLGEPRTESAGNAKEGGPCLYGPALVLSAICVLVGLLGPLVILSLKKPLEILSGLEPEALNQGISAGLFPLILITVALFGLILLAIGLLYWRKKLLERSGVSKTVTWDCGYAAPTPRMQYTSSSFAEPLLGLFRNFLKSKKHAALPEGCFPEKGKAHFESETPDLCRERLFDPLFAGIATAFSKLRWLQGGRVQFYVLYIVITLLALLIWKMG